MFVRKNKQKLAAIAHPGRAESKVDKNRAKCLNLVYRPQKWSAHPQKWSAHPRK